MTRHDAPPPVPDDVLMAFVDGELEPEAARQLQHRLATDADLAQRVAAQRALRARLTRAFAADLDEPLPASLLAMLPVAPRRPAAAPAPSTLDAVRAARDSRAPVPGRAAWARTAMAACLVGGVVLGWWLRPALQGEAPVGAELMARGELARALDLPAAAAQEGKTAASVRVLLTVRRADGSYCRAFSTGTAAGLACRADDGWRVHTMVAREPAGGAAPDSAMRLAGAALPAALLQAVDAVAAGPSLDARAEQAAAARGWSR